MKMKVNGVTFWICFGKYGGFSFQGYKLTLGWVSFCIFPMDIECLLSDLIKRIDKLEEATEILKQIEQGVVDTNRIKRIRSLLSELEVGNGKDTTPK